jgi:hypothetical protein
MGERHVLSVAPTGLTPWAESHGSRRGLIADAPTGAGKPHRRSLVLKSEAIDTIANERIPEQVSKLRIKSGPHLSLGIQELV